MFKAIITATWELPLEQTAAIELGLLFNVLLRWAKRIEVLIADNEGFRAVVRPPNVKDRLFQGLLLEALRHDVEELAQNFKKLDVKVEVTRDDNNA